MPFANFFKRHRRILAVEAILLLLTIGALLILFFESEYIKIAVVFDHEDSRQSITIQNLLNVYAERINKYGGIKCKDKKGKIKRKQLKFIYDYCDNGSPEEAKKIAKKIIGNNNIFAVIGHFNAETTAAAAPIYDKAKKRLFAPLSHIDINSQWVFQVSPAPGDYGLYTAHYINKILKKQFVTIIHSEEKDDIDIVKSFAKAFTDLGGQIERKISVSNQNKESFKEQCDDIASKVKDKGNNILFLATQPEQTIPLIVALKNKDIKIPIMSMDNNLGNSLNASKCKHEKYPVSFLDDIYAPSVLLFDNLWKELALVDKDYTLKAKKDKITLASMKAVLAAYFIKLLSEKGPSAQVLDDWFNGQKVIRPTKLVIGVYNGRHFVKAPINPFTVNVGDVSDEFKEKLLKIDNRLLYPADVIYSGVAMNKISNINQKKLTYDLDFFVWFRYQYGVKHADDIEFLNSIEGARLSDVVKETKRRKHKKIVTPEGAMTASLVRKTTYPEKNPRWGYSCYRVTGRFETNNAKNYALGQQDLYVMFRNYRQNKFKLNYVVDYMNNNGGMYSREVMENSDRKEQMANLIDDPQLELKYTYTYLADSEKTMLGLPEERVRLCNDFSKLVAEYRVKPVLLSFKGMVARLNGIISETTGDSQDEINLQVMIICFAVTFALFLLSIYGDHTSASNKYSKWWWLLKLSVILFMLFFAELVVSQLLYDFKNSAWGISHQRTIGSIMYYWEKISAVVGCLVLAYYIASAFEQFLWHPIERRIGTGAPRILHLFVKVIIYTMAGLGIMYYVFEINSNSLIATSGAVAVLFAVASKIDLSNVLAGLGIAFSKIFKIGDWVKVDSVEGQVFEMTSRSTKILTFDKSVINIPNSKVAGAVIENFNRPDTAYRLIIHMELVPVYRFERVEKLLLDAVVSTEGVLDTPKPFVIFKGQGDSCQIYEVAFYIDNYAKRAVLWQATWRRIWRHLEQGGIEMATPQREVFLPKKPVENFSSPLTVINNSGAFAELADEEKVQLSKRAEQRSCRAGEVIVFQEKDQVKIFIITEGVISLSDSEGQEKRLAVADVFGMDDLPEHTAVTAITDSELLSVRKDDFRTVTEGDAELDKALSNSIV